MIGLDRLSRTLTRARVRMMCLRRRPTRALDHLRPVAARHPTDVELRLRLAELELAAGELQRAIAEAAIAIQLAPGDVRGMSLLLQAQALMEAGAGTTGAADV
jgi:Flp pilus assembly protein TadD